MPADIDQILADACENKFNCITDEKTRDVILAELLYEQQQAIESLVATIGQ